MPEKLHPQAIKILAILRNGLWACPIQWNYADGHAKRLTDINRFVIREGLKVESAWCDCGRHTTRVKKRRLVPIKPISDYFFSAQYYEDREKLKAKLQPQLL